MNTENNKIIAEFMGVSKSKIEINGKILNFENSKHNTYHKDWNWLMELVDKIEDLNYSIEINKQEENDYQCLIVKKDTFIQKFSNTKIEAVYNACVGFIKWYNEQNR